MKKENEENDSPQKAESLNAAAVVETKVWNK